MDTDSGRGSEPNEPPKLANVSRLHSDDAEASNATTNEEWYETERLSGQITLPPAIPRPTSPRRHTKTRPSSSTGDIPNRCHRRPRSSAWRKLSPAASAVVDAASYPLRRNQHRKDVGAGGQLSRALAKRCQRHLIPDKTRWRCTTRAMDGRAVRRSLRVEPAARRRSGPSDNPRHISLIGPAVGFGPASTKSCWAWSRLGLRTRSRVASQRSCRRHRASFCARQYRGCDR
jgi:hypothetical protein